MTNVLFISSNHADYLADSLLHGLKSLPEVNAIDYPKVEILYKTSQGKYPIRGGGFTLYTLLEDIPVDRTNIKQKLQAGAFDIVIFSSIHRQFSLFLELYPVLGRTKTIIADGEDSPALFPYRGDYWRDTHFWFLPKVHKEFIYYKREWTPATIRYRWYKLLPEFICRLLPAPENLRTISFSIPKEKILKILTTKTKLFPKHIVDPEVSRHIEGSQVKYPFDSEYDYYTDLQSSRFGITTKRSGWDCLRHYEIAANGTVPCFLNLDRKPATCAPHGLDSSNSIAYSDYHDLFTKIKNLSPEAYTQLQNGAWEWAKRNTTIHRAYALLNQHDLMKTKEFA